jgi:ferric iron reductase protein FhuF
MDDYMNNYTFEDFLNSTTVEDVIELEKTTLLEEKLIDTILSRYDDNGLKTPDTLNIGKPIY